MSFIELFILAIGLSMDAFAVAISKGLSLGKIHFKEVIIVGLWFGLFQALMPVIGYFLGSYFGEFISHYAHWVAFILLALIGINMIRESYEHPEEADPSLDFKSMLTLAIATSIDALAVGVSLALLKANILEAATIIGVTTFVLSGIGVKIGSLFGMRYKSKAELAGGIILIVIGLKILLDGLGFFG